MPPAWRRFQSKGPCLHDSGMEVEVVRHHCRPDDAKRQIQHLGVGHDFGRRREAADDLTQSGSAMAIWTKKQAAITPKAR